MITADKIAGLLNGRLVGDGAVAIENVASVEDSGPNLCTFAVTAKYAQKAEELGASCCLVKEPLEGSGMTQIVVDDPKLAMIQLALHLHPPASFETGISGQAFIDPSADVSESATVYPFAYVGPGSSIGDRTVLLPGAVLGRDVKVGADCLFYPNVSIGDRCIISDRVILHSGVIIGADGFGYLQMGGTNLKIPQTGIVVIEDDVEIGANSCVDRATFGETRIGTGTKIDNLCQIAHNVRIGSHCIVVSQAGLAGSSSMGDRSVIAARSALVDHASIGADVMVGAWSAVKGSVPNGAKVGGVPAFEGYKWKKYLVLQEKLPDMYAQIKRLEREVAALKKKSNEGEGQK